MFAINMDGLHGVTVLRDNTASAFFAEFLEFSPMEIKVNFLDKLRLEAKLDDLTMIAESFQPEFSKKRI